MTTDNRANGPTEVFDRAALCERLMGDEELMREILEIFLGDAPSHITNLRQALGAGDRRTIEILAHTLKGSAATVNAEGLTRVALRLERNASDDDVSLADLGALVDQLASEFEIFKTLIVNSELA